MLRLYKTVDNQLHYWQTWIEGKKNGIIHWGLVGQRGQSEAVRSDSVDGYKAMIEKQVLEKMAEGYAAIDEEDFAYLEIVYSINGFGTDADIEKRHRLEDLMDELLAWTGLGHADGGSAGSGTMEVGCVVVDFDIAKNVIDANLMGTEFSDYARIVKISPH